MKLVNVYSTKLLNIFRPPSSVIKRAQLSLLMIKKCLMAGARVEEILPDDTIVTLNFDNYNLDNTNSINIVKEVITDVTIPEPVFPEGSEGLDNEPEKKVNEPDNIEGQETDKEPEEPGLDKEPDNIECQETDKEPDKIEGAEELDGEFEDTEIEEGLDNNFNDTIPSTPQQSDQTHTKKGRRR